MTQWMQRTSKNNAVHIQFNNRRLEWNNRKGVWEVFFIDDRGVITPYFEGKDLDQALKHLEEGPITHLKRKTNYN